MPIDLPRVADEAAPNLHRTPGCAVGELVSLRGTRGIAVSKPGSRYSTVAGQGAAKSRPTSAVMPGKRAHPSSWPALSGAGSA